MNATNDLSYNKELRDQLEAYRREHNLSQGDLGIELGCHASAVSKYLSGKPAGDVAKLEAVIEDVLKNAERRKNQTVELFVCDSYKKINSGLELIRKTNDIGLLHGEAGVGKTCGCQLYARYHPSAVLLTLSRWHRSDSAVCKLLFTEVETRGFKRSGMTKAEFLVSKFKHSNRLIIFDNAHRLSRTGREWIFDFVDQTGVPVALVGNPEILDAIKASDQHFSRIGLKREIRITDPGDVVDKIAARITPGGAPVIKKLGLEVMQKQGHARAFRKQLSLATELMATEPDLSNLEDAFRASHTQLVREYQLA